MEGCTLLPGLVCECVKAWYTAVGILYQSVSTSPHPGHRVCYLLPSFRNYVA